MKRLIFSGLLMLLVLCACSRTTQIEESLAASSAKEDAIQVADAAELIYEKMGEKDKSIWKFSGSGIFYLDDFVGAGDQYFRKKGSKTYVDFGEYPFLVVGAGSEVIMQERYLYTAEKLIIDEKEKLLLYKLDGETGERKDIWEEPNPEEHNPLIYFHKLSKTEFVGVFHTELSSRIVRYDCTTDVGTEIITERKEKREDVILGSSLIKVCAMDGELYVLIYEKTEDTEKRYINVYDREGKWLRKINTDAAAGLLYVGALDMHAINGYIHFSNWNMQNGIYKIEGDQLREVYIEPPLTASSEKLLVRTTENTYRNNEGAYIYIYKRLESNEIRQMEGKEIKPQAPVLYALELESEKLQQVKLDFDKDFPYLSSVFVDENGNIIVNMAQETEGTGAERSYYFKAEDMKKILAPLPKEPIEMLYEWSAG